MQPTLSGEPAPLTLAREKLRLVLYGDPGVGKTTLAATAPRPFFIDTDGGLISIAVEGEAPVTFAPQGYKDVEGLYFWLRDRSDEFDTVVIDSIDSLQRLLLDEIVDQGRAKASGNSILEFVPEQAEYLANQRQIQRILHAMRQLDKHVIVTAAVRERSGKRVPDVSPGLLNYVQRWSSVTGELVVAAIEENDEPQRVLAVAPSPQRETKTRFRSLLPYIVAPTFPKLWAAIETEYQTKEKTK